MSTRSIVYISDDELFKRADSTVLDSGILLGRICQLEPSQETLEALIALSKEFVTIPALSALTFKRKQKAYPELFHQALEEFVRDYTSQPATLLLEAAHVDYVRLLVGIGDPLAAPWESVYLSQERSIFQESTLDVRRWFHSYGLKSKLEYNEPDDHVGLILEFICSTIKERIAYTQPTDESANSDCLAIFINEHFLNWVETWNSCIQQNAQTSYYKVLGWFMVYIAMYFSNLLQSDTQ